MIENNGTGMTLIIMMNTDKKILINHINPRHPRSIVFAK